MPETLPAATRCWIFACIVLAGCSQPPADLVFTNGAVYTVDEARSWAEAVAISDGRIVYVGGNYRANRYIGSKTEVIDLGGRMLLPGFHDSHMHPMAAGTRFFRCQLNNLQWPEEVLAQLRECAANLAEGEWLRGVELADEVFDLDYPFRDVIDEIFNDRPAVITNFSGMLVWTNSKGLEEVGFDATTPDPKRGQIGRIAGTSEPNGLLSGEAGGALYGRIPLYSVETFRRSLAAASRMANSFGITSTNEASLRPRLIEAYVQSDRAGEMTLRVQGAQYWNRQRGLEQVDEMAERRDTSRGQMFRADTIKLFLDGVNDTGTAALLEPYAGTTDDYGESTYSDETLKEIVTSADAANFDLHFHALGDAAVRQALDAIEFAIDANETRDRRHQLAHLELIDSQDLPRFSELGVAANYQLLWAWFNDEQSHTSTLLGDERAQYMLAINSTIKSGALVVAGSDWISDSMNPLYSIQIAVTRRPPDGSGPAWLPEERASLEDMIAAYTINGAKLARQDQLTGSIEVGKAADLVVLDKNLFEIDPMQIANVKVLLTLLNGESVYRAADFN